MDDSDPPARASRSTDLVPAPRRDDGTSRRALRILKQRMPGLPSKGDVLETALVIGGLGLVGTLAWPYVMAVLAIPIMLVKVGMTGAAIYAAYWIYSKLAGGGGAEADDEDPDEDP